MSIFTLHSNVVSDYRDFVRSFFSVDDARACEFIERELVQEARLWPRFERKPVKSSPFLRFHRESSPPQCHD